MIMKPACFALLVLFASTMAAPALAQSTTVQDNRKYMIKPADPPPKINTQGWADSPYISQDGRALYFMYSPYNFFPALKGTGKPEKRGPPRKGHNDNVLNPYWDSDLYISRINPLTGAWKSPVNLLSVNDTRDNCCAMVVEGMAGYPTRIYMQREIPGQSIDIIYREMDNAGMWSDVIEFPRGINTMKYNEENPHVSTDHRRIYFSSNRPGGYGDKDIWFTYKIADGKFSPPANLGPMINTGAMEDQFWMADKPDAKGNYEVYFNRTGSQIWGTTWNKRDGFAPPAPIDLGFQHVGEASVTADGKKMYFASGNPETELIRIMVSERGSDGKWMRGKAVD